MVPLIGFAAFLKTFFAASNDDAILYVRLFHLISECQRWSQCKYIVNIINLTEPLLAHKKSCCFRDCSNAD